MYRFAPTTVFVGQMVELRAAAFEFSFKSVDTTVKLLYYILYCKRNIIFQNSQVYL